MPNDNLSNLIISLQKDFNIFKKDLVGLKSDFGGLRKDLVGLKSDFGGLRTEVSELKNNSDGLRTEVSELKNNSDGLRTEVSRIRKDFDNFRKETTQNFSEVFSKLDNHTGAIMAVENTMGFYGDMYKMNKEKIDNHENRMCVLEAK